MFSRDPQGSDINNKPLLKALLFFTINTFIFSSRASYSL